MIVIASKNYSISCILWNKIDMYEIWRLFVRSVVGSYIAARALLLFMSIFFALLSLESFLLLALFLALCNDRLMLLAFSSLFLYSF